MKAFFGGFNALRFASCGLGSSFAPPESGFKRIADIDKILTSTIKDQPGLSLLVVKDGATVFKKSYGLADAERAIALTEDAPLSLYSLSKQFTALAILLLENEGKLSTKDAIGNYMNFIPQDKKSVKIADLIFHRSGIKDYGWEDYYNAEACSVSTLEREGDFVALQSKCCDPDLLSKESILRSLNKPFSFKTGQKRQYANINYWLLGRIIEKASGLKYDDFIKTIIFQMAGLSGFFNVNDTKEQEALPHGPSPLYRRISNALSGASHSSDSDGGLFLSLNEMEKYLHFLHGNALDASIKEKFLKEHDHLRSDRSNNFYGYGWFHSPEGAVFHTGSFYGGRCLLSLREKAGVSIFIHRNAHVTNVSLMTLESRILKCLND